MKIKEKRSLKNGIIEGTISLTIATIIVKVLGAIYKIPISYILGEEGMGYFNSAYTVYSFFYILCTAGVPKAIMILIGNAEKDDLGEKEKNILRSAICFFAAFGLVVSLIFFAFAKPLASLIGSGESYKTMLAIAPSILFVSVAGVLRGYMSAHVKFLHVAVSQIVEGAGKLVFGLLFASIADRLYMPLNVVSAFTIFGVTCGSIAGLIYLIINCKVKNSDQKPRQKSFKNDYSIVKDILKISLPITVSAAVMSITNMIDLGLIMRRLVSAGYSEIDATSLYGNYTTYATPMFNLVISLLTPITIAFMPSLVRESKNKESFMKILEQEFLLTFWILIPVTIGMCVYSKEVLSFLFREEGILIGSRLLTYLSLSLFFAAPLLVLNSALEASGEIKAPMISMIVGSIFKLIVSYFLISNPKFGILGAPIGTLASYIAALCVSLIIAYRRKNISAPIFKTVALPAINSFIAIFAVYPLYLKLTLVNDKITFLVSVLVTVCLYVLLSLSTDIKVKLKEYKRQTAQIDS